MCTAATVSSIRNEYNSGHQGWAGRRWELLVHRVPALPGLVAQACKLHALRRLRQEDQEFRANLGLHKTNLAQSNKKWLKWQRFVLHTFYQNKKRFKIEKFVFHSKCEAPGVALGQGLQTIPCANPVSN